MFKYEKFANYNDDDEEEGDDYEGGDGDGDGGDDYGNRGDGDGYGDGDGDGDRGDGDGGGISAIVNGVKQVPVYTGSGKYYYNIFTYSSTGGKNTFKTSNNLTCDILVVAGGGGGGNGMSAGGGGAGAFFYKTGYKLKQGSYNISVGKGGGGGGNNGDDTIITDSKSNTIIKMIGGGGGGSYSGNISQQRNGKLGGSGGGANGTGYGYNDWNRDPAGSAENIRNIPSGIYGNAGGIPSSWYSGGGGGGAGGVPLNTQYNASLSGGAGVSNNITGSSVTYAKGGAGGYSSSYSDAVSQSSVINNTGSGGNGGFAGNSAGSTNGAQGSSGVVIIRYLKSSLSFVDNSDVACTVNGVRENLKYTGSGKIYYIDYEYSATGGASTFQVKSKNLTCDILVIGGGGAGGRSGNNGNGGGAGAMIYKQNQKLSKGTYTIVVGKGGTHNNIDETSAGNNGGDSSIYFNNQYIFYAYGGGGGGAYGYPAKSGGSSGGSNYGSAATVNNNNIPSGTYGNIGGSYDYWPYAGGGGGAGGAGSFVSSTGISYWSNSGGKGISNNITGTSVTYAKGGNAAMYNDDTYIPADPIDGTGNGGDGTQYNKRYRKNGSSGIVIIAFNVSKDDDGDGEDGEGHGDDDYGEGRGDDDYEGRGDDGEGHGDGGSKGKSSSGAPPSIAKGVGNLCAISGNNMIIGHTGKANIFVFKNSNWEYTDSISQS